MKHILLLIVFLTFGLLTPLGFAQVVKEVEPGCKFSWKEPMVDNPSIPGTKIGAWELAGDLAGFQWVTNTEPVFDALKMQLFPEPALRELDCLQVGVETPDDYFVMIKAFDTSNNSSDQAELQFRLVEQDSTAPSRVLDFCLTYIFQGIENVFCGQMDVKPITP